LFDPCDTPAFRKVSFNSNDDDDEDDEVLKAFCGEEKEDDFFERNKMLSFLKSC
jgi:hypothetical protein